MDLRAAAPRPRVLDAALALAFAVVACAEVLLGPLADDVVEGPVWLNVLAVLAGTLPLAWRRAFPLWVSLVLYGALAGRALAAEPLELYPTFLALLVATYTVASYAPLRDAVLAATVTGLALAVAVVRGSGTDAAPDPLASTILVGTVWLVGRVVGVRNARARALHDARDAHAAEAVGRERARIAHEVHDSVTHNLAAIVTQAGGAAHLLDRDPERARAALTAIEESARRGLDEMRRSLGLLGAGDPTLSPAPGVAALPALVERVRTAGVDVDLQLVGNHRDVAPPTDAATFRIVQEALTNVMKHAGPCRARVRVRRTADEIEIEVDDDGQARVASAGSGLGLPGMRERAASVGGTVVAGPTDHGFRVVARLPT